jgi:hypothetical protein
MLSSDQQALAAAQVLERFSLEGSEYLSQDTVRAAVSAVTRLYWRAVEQAGEEIPPVDAEMPTTEALTLSCALLRSQNLTPFDMALWFSRHANGSARQEMA